MSTDDPGEGFNDPTPVAPVLGNRATTLGGQRQRVFEAVAWRLGTQIASPVEIRVEAGWESLDCSANRGTLASAGPSFVFRDFPGAPRGSTWYAGALADALAGSELGSPDENEMSVTFNADVGTASCLTRSRWDYRIGAVRSAGFSMEKVLFHELGHGINFTTFVDRETGEKFQDRDDAFMIHLEDHATNRRWSAMSDAQRVASSTRTGELHWLGGNALAHAVRLRGGAHDPSGHPRMYAPDPLEGGSSVSHWDTVMTRNVDEFMEPFATSSNTDLLSRFLLQDVGWSVNRSAVAWVEDQNGNGVIELAVLRVNAEPGGHEIVLIDALSREVLRAIPVPAGFAALDLAAVSHFAGPPASEIVVLLWKPQGNVVRVMQFDASTGEQVGEIGFPSSHPMRLVPIADFVGGPADELAVLALRNNRRGRVWVKDAETGTTHTTIGLSRRQLPVDLVLVDSFGATGAPELAVLVAIPTGERSEIQVRDGASKTLLARIPLPEGEVYQHLAALADFGGAVGVPELAVAGLTAADGAPTLRVLDASTGEELAARSFTEAFVPAALAVLPNFAGTMADELALWTRRAESLRPRGYVVDGGSMDTLSTRSLSSRYSPLAFAVLPNLGRSDADEIAVLASSVRDRRLRAFLIDGGGSKVRTLTLP